MVIFRNIRITRNSTSGKMHGTNMANDDKNSTKEVYLPKFHENGGSTLRRQKSPNK